MPIWHGDFLYGFNKTVKDHFNLMLLLQVQSSQFLCQRCPSNGSIHRNVGCQDSISSSPEGIAYVDQGRAGISNPRSIREIELEATFVISASCSWVMPRSLRMRCIACPPCLKSTAIPPTSMFHPYYERTRRVNSRTLWTKLNV